MIITKTSHWHELRKISHHYIYTTCRQICCLNLFFVFCFVFFFVDTMAAGLGSYYL